MKKLLLKFGIALPFALIGLYFDNVVLGNSSSPFLWGMLAGILSDEIIEKIL